ncbi:glycosyltransferase family 2 protein [Gallaecimonas xiamenensis]|uniref:Glycosyl transferase family protein n=1 Tax=Gallaecimonas xiamenensis 3-C-1 TaxID=745411 RepID=K2JKB4_9GAMM|nr:glycosyltransferase [Gallaecimonas xiamenensis]EKE70999.1 glycosyl transferase family protein [Gallaecimonas xiamenensis 3-C-1]
MSSLEYFLHWVSFGLLNDSHLLAKLLPMLILFEMPLMMLVLTGIARYYRRRHLAPQGPQRLYQPRVSCIVTCYSEGRDVLKTMQSLVEQSYQGVIEVIMVVDGAVQNKATFSAAQQGASRYRGLANRKVLVLPKWQRGGRVSSLNAGLSWAKGDIVMALDGDTSFDATMVSELVKHFADPHTLAAGGGLRVRNWRQSLATRMQAIEYLISMQGGRTGLAQWDLLNNISGAFGSFRRRPLQRMGGWDTHTAEDLDMTLRLNQYRRRHPSLRLPYEPAAVGHTDVPATWRQLFTQRLRWDGDLLFMYLRKHKDGLRPRLMGLKSFLFILVYGIGQNILLPFLIVLFTLWLLINYPLALVMSLFLVLYGLYLGLGSLLFCVYLLAISERPRQDVRLLPFLVLYPLYSFVMRMVSVVALINEWLRRSHEESSMAPWWVLKRGRKF